MHRDACKLLLSLSLLVLGGCDLKRELVGETLTGPGPDGASSTSGTTDGDATDADDSITTTATSPTTGAPDGIPCQLGPAEAWEEGSPPVPGQPVDHYGAGPIVTPGPDCAGDVCLYAGFDPPNCEDDAVCAGDERLTGSCGEFQCDIDPAWGDAHTTCTRTCEVDTDCPVIPGCNEGPVCAAFSRLGSLCCQKICGCRDQADEGFLQETEWACKTEPYQHCQ